MQKSNNKCLRGDEYLATKREPKSITSVWASSLESFVATMSPHCTDINTAKKTVPFQDPVFQRSFVKIQITFQ